MLWGRVCEANYLCRTLVPRMPIDAETDWLIRKGSLLQKQCSLLPVAAIAGGLPIAHTVVSPFLPCLPLAPPNLSPHSCLSAFSLFSSVTSWDDQLSSPPVSSVPGKSYVHSHSQAFLVHYLSN